MQENLNSWATDMGNSEGDHTDWKHSENVWSVPKDLLQQKYVVLLKTRCYFFVCFIFLSSLFSFSSCSREW